MYRRTVFAALCMFVLLTLPHTGMASLTPLTDVAMSDVTGQAGIEPQAIGMASLLPLAEVAIRDTSGQEGIDSVEISNGVTRMTFDNHYDNIPILHGLLNLGDVTIQGAIETRSDSSVTVSQVSNSTLTGLSGLGIMGFGMSGLAGLGTMSVGTHHIDAAMDIDRLSIGAIRIGQDLTGPSLGSLDIIGMHTEIKGTISISMH
jgi:hypothetical protein